METNSRNKENRQTDTSVNIIDILLYLLSYWKWFLLTLVVCLGLAYYKYIHTGPTYFSSIDVMINDPSEKSNVIGLDRYNNAINSVNVANEMHMLQSKELLEKMVQNTHADLNFTIRIQLYQGDMYGREPVDIVFYDSIRASRGVSFSMRIQDEKYVILSDFYEDGPVLKVPFDAMVDTPAGKLKLTLTDKFDNSWINLETHVTKYPLESVVRKYHNAISIRQDDESASILTLALQDNSYRRAQAVLKGLIDVYNADAMESKNLVSVNTAKFLEERIEVIGLINDATSYWIPQLPLRCMLQSLTPIAMSRLIRKFS